MAYTFHKKYLINIYMYNGVHNMKLLGGWLPPGLCCWALHPRGGTARTGSFPPAPPDGNTLLTIL